MTLILDLVGPPRLMGARNRFELRSGSATVGRSPEADWVIPDLNRMISRRHLRIDRSGGDFVLTDTSSNGVYVNASEVPVGYGASVKLRDGDRLRFGEAEVAVAVAVEGPAQAGLPGDAPQAPRGQPNGLRDPLGGPFATSSPGPAEAEGRRGDRPEIIDANWMIEPSSLRPEHDRGTVLPLRIEEPRAQARDAAASPTSDLLALVERHPHLSARQLAGVVDAAMRMMEPSAQQALYEEISQSMRLST